MTEAAEEVAMVVESGEKAREYCRRKDDQHEYVIV